MMPRYRGAADGLFLALAPESASKTQAPADDALPFTKNLPAQNFVATENSRRLGATKSLDDAETSEGTQGVPRIDPVGRNGRLRTHRPSRCGETEKESGSWSSQDERIES
jgi:hypothetical protein